METYHKEMYEFFEEQKRQIEEEQNKKTEICKKYCPYSYNHYVKYGYYKDLIGEYYSLDELYEKALKIKKVKDEELERYWEDQEESEEESELRKKS